MSHTGSVPETKRKTDWRDEGLCRSEDPDLFFASEQTAQGKANVRHAKTICFRCPSQWQCGQWALETRQPFGVWGGVSGAERRSILRRRGVRIKDVDPDNETEAAA